jgi:predicted small metal-binding protein
MDGVLHCNCGYVASGADEEELIGAVQRHAREAHAMTLTHEEVLLLVFRAELYGPASTPSAGAASRGRTRRRPRFLPRR